MYSLMMSLFSSFDLNFFILCFFSLTSFMFLGSSICSKVNPISLMIFNSLDLLAGFFSSSFSKKVKSFDFFLLSLFLCIFFFNVLSAGPFIFPFTSQISVVGCFSLIYWATLFLSSLFFGFRVTFSHFIPEGTPLILTWFIFMIEFISNIIRPFTLFIRLLSNILSGHVMLILLAKMVSLYSASFFLYFFFDLVENFVGFMQAFIFSVMISIYFTGS